MWIFNKIFIWLKNKFTIIILQIIYDVIWILVIIHCLLGLNIIQIQKKTNKGENTKGTKNCKPFLWNSKVIEKLWFVRMNVTFELMVYIAKNKNFVKNLYTNIKPLSVIFLYLFITSIAHLYCIKLFKFKKIRFKTNNILDFLVNYVINAT